MFEELKRLFGSAAPPRDGLSRGDSATLEVLDLGLLRSEARAADIAAGRISAKDPAQRRLEAARVWRELARRTGDAAALRKAAQGAEKAAEAFKSAGRSKAWCAARCEQAMCAMLGVELFGDEGLFAAADLALAEVVAAAPNSPGAVLALGQLARLKARAVMADGPYEAVMAVASSFDRPIERLAPHLHSRAVSKSALADIRCARAQMMIAAAGRFGDAALYTRAQAEMDILVAGLDSAREPLAHARAVSMAAAARSGGGRLADHIEDVAAAVDMLARAVDSFTSDHSPLDWARLQHALARALQDLGEESQADHAFERALGAYRRALWAVQDKPALALRVDVARGYAGCLARRATLAGNPRLLDQAVGQLRQDLARLHPGRDPVGWAVAQVNLAQLYAARLGLVGGEQDRAAAALALSSAIEVFEEHGLSPLTEDATAALAAL
jgi:tetratricopeptide (TPR) repeat protein